MNKNRALILTFLLIAGLSIAGSVLAQQNDRTGFLPNDRNLNVGESVQLEYYVQGNQRSGQWFSLVENILENLGGGLFRAKSEGYGTARISHSSGSAQTFVGVIDPNKPIDTTYDVSLVKRHPVYTWRDAKYNDAHGVSPFTNIDYISTGAGVGRFAVLGACADGLDAEFHQVEFEDGGLYLLSEDGQFLDKENVCKATVDWYSACYEGGGCTIGLDVHPTGSGSFLLDTGDSSTGAFRRSPLLYSVSSSGASQENRLFFSDKDNPVEPEEDVEVIEFRYIAHANGVMVGVAEETTGETHARISGFPGSTRSIEVKNIFYSVPEFGRLAEISTPTRCSSRSCSGSPSVTQAVYTPLFGVGEYFVAKNDSGYGVYRMPSREELRNGVIPEKVQDINPPRGSQFNYFTYDSANSSRVMVTSINPAGNYVVYEPGENGIEAVETGTLDTTFALHNFALMGEYIAYTTCEAGSGSSPVTGAVNQLNCELVVEKSDQKLTVEPLPLNVFSPRSFGSMPGVSISPSGKILVSAHNETGIYGDNDNLYLYQINELGGVTTTPPIPPGTPPILPTFPNQINLNLEVFLRAAESYARGIFDIFGTRDSNQTTTTQSSTQSYTGPCPPTTEAEIRSFQCAYNIVCSGTKETTGYGNFGPLTSAKANEVCYSEVRGASVSLDTNAINSIKSSLAKIAETAKSFLPVD